MTDVQHTLLALICLGSAYLWGRTIGVKAGIVATLEHLEEEGVISFKREDDEDE